MRAALGLNDGYNSSAALMVDGTVVACAQEERFTRVKNQSGYPRLAVEYCLAAAGLDAGALETVVLGGLLGHYPEDPSRRPPLRPYSALQVAAKALEYRLPVTRAHQVLSGAFRRGFAFTNAAARRHAVTAHLELAPAKVMFAPHHEAHAAASLFFGLPAGATILTADGEGDHVSATVSRWTGSVFEPLAATGLHHSLGNVWAAATAYLRMKPHEHEHKLMGLAPYADATASGRAAARVAQLIGLDGGGLGFRSPYSTRMAMSFIEDRCREFRFDILAGGLQAHTEDLLRRWARNAVIRAGGAGTVGLGGGVFMNVKANQRIAELEEVDRVLPVPGCGDESLALGALAWWQVRAGRRVEELDTLALGPEYDEAAIRTDLEGTGLRVSKPRSLDAAVALLLSEGEVVARFDGRMEFGARALGQRSILGHPGRRELVAELNSQIKNRDFWMPFAPSILENEAARYIENPKALPAPHMMLTFDSTERGRAELAAAIHPADATTRPQLVPAATPYGRLIEAFRRRTGTAAVLNTSFNLHGEPIVCSPRDAVDTLLRSGLKHLAIGPYLVSKPADAEGAAPGARPRTATLGSS